MKILFLITCVCCIFYEICDAYVYRTFYYRQKVDHFSYTNEDYFLQRYLMNLDHYSFHGNGTLFVYTGNEGDIEMFAKNTGFMWEHAAIFNAALVFIEHRYYGSSLPYGNLSFKNKTYLGYLTSEQALADYATMITFLKQNLPEGDKVPCIVFGGSYGGMLAAWMRIKYPHIVNGAIASSAPILAFAETTPCELFPEIVTRDFLVDGGLDCINSIQNSWSIIRRIYNETGGMKHLIQDFHLCKNDSFDINDLMQWLFDTWTFMAMTDYPYPTNFLNPLPAFPIKEACKYLQNSTVPDEEILFNIYKAVSVFHNYTGQVKCFNFEESGGKSLGTAGWNFQSCTEMVQSVCQSGVSDMFEPIKWNFTAFAENCFEKYGVRPEMSKTIWMYGGDALKSSSNIVFTNGLLDPWYGSGILYSISDTVVAIIMDGAAHHLDLRSSNSADPPSVIDARHQIVKWIGYFSTEARKNMNRRVVNVAKN